MRKVVFVFLLFTILFLPGFVRADGMTTKLPPPPTGVENYVVGYVPSLDTYRLGSTDYNGSIYISSDNTLVDSNGDNVIFGDMYELINGSWTLYSSTAYWIAWFDDAGFIDSGDSGAGKVIVFSSNNFYGTNGQLLAAASDEDVFSSGLTLIGKFISSSSLLLFLFVPFRKILLPVLVCIVLIFAFRLAWGWLRATFINI